MRRPRLVACAIIASLLACGVEPPARDPNAERLRGGTNGALPSAMSVGDARFVPVSIRADAKRFGGSTEGRRLILSGVRLIELPSGGALSATTTLPNGALADGSVVEVPERMGGGFLFLIGSSVHRADDWLAPTRVIFTSPSQPTSSIVRMVVGLDRVYLQLDKGAYVPIDPRTGEVLDLGTFPRAPFVTSLITLDGWRAAALADGRGVVVSSDAGATWSPIKLAADPISLDRVGDMIVLRANEAGRAAWFEITTDGRVGRLARVQAPPDTDDDQPDADAEAAPVTTPFGARPLTAAIEDGWLLGDGTAVVARDGAIGRVRIADGALVELARDAYPLKPSRCHPFSLARKTSPAAFGFACGAPHGATELYAYDPSTGAPILLKRFDGPRVIGSSGNGAIWARGACAPEAPNDDEARGRQTYCLLGHDNRFTDFVVQGEIGAQRIAVLADGRRVVISPPSGGSLASGSITVLDKGVSKTSSIVWEPDAPAERAGVEQVLRNGTWLESFEERKTGKLSGWVVWGRTALGIDIAMDGHARHGAWNPDMGAPLVAGAYGIGWGAHGYETNDGGATWRQAEMPPSLPNDSHGDIARVCGPIGCEMGGWLRVGWGTRPNVLSQSVSSIKGEPSPSTATLRLSCEAVSKLTPLTYVPFVAPPHAKTYEWQPLFSMSPPKLADDDYAWGIAGPTALVGTNTNAQSRSPRVGDVNVQALAHYYSWGPRDQLLWALKGRALARWTSPFEASTNVHSSQVGAIPEFVSNVVAPLITGGRGGSVLDAGGLALGEDGGHALWVFGRASGASGASQSGALLLEPDRGATEVRRSDGTDLLSIESAVRAGGRWYLTTASDPDEPSATVVWEVEAATAHELARLPRVSVPQQWQPSNTPPGARIARSADGRSVGVVLDGQPNAKRFLTNQRWVIPIDLSSGLVLEPQPLGAADVTNTATVCEPGAGGWVMDVPFNNQLWYGNDRLSSTIARVHLDGGHACIEKVASTGAIDPTALSKHTSDFDGPQLDVTAFYEGQRVLMHCHRP